MPLRDLLMLSALLVMVPMIFIRPHTGAILWAWTAMLVPNIFLFGIGQSLRYNLIFAVATLLAWVVSKEPKRKVLGTSMAVQAHRMAPLCGRMKIMGTMTRSAESMRRSRRAMAQGPRSGGEGWRPRRPGRPGPSAGSSVGPPVRPPMVSR